MARCAVSSARAVVAQAHNTPLASCTRAFAGAAFQSQEPARTLKEARAHPCKHRDAKLADEPMPNFNSTPGAPNGVPLAFRASWELNSRPRRIALLLDDVQEEYRPFALPILPNLVELTASFRAKGCPIMWSSWSRFFDDGICNAMDRWYGPRGLCIEEPENACYIFTGEAGLQTLKEILPTPEEVAAGWFYHSKHLDMFWTFGPDGKSYLDEKLKGEGVDTVVICGLWTDECIVSTAFAASSRGYDVVVPSDAVATATANHEIALTLLNGTCGKVLPTQDVISYMAADFVLGERGAVKGVAYPDGRKDD